jgi:hypothetical protein
VLSTLGSSFEGTNTNRSNCTNAGWAKTNTESTELTETQRKNSCYSLYSCSKKCSPSHPCLSVLSVVPHKCFMFYVLCFVLWILIRENSRYSCSKKTSTIASVFIRAIRGSKFQCIQCFLCSLKIPTFCLQKTHSCKFEIFVFEKLLCIQCVLCSIFVHRYSSSRFRPRKQYQCKFVLSVFKKIARNSAAS